MKTLSVTSELRLYDLFDANLAADKWARDKSADIVDGVPPRLDSAYIGFVFTDVVRDRHWIPILKVSLRIKEVPRRFLRQSNDTRAASSARTSNTPNAIQFRFFVCRPTALVPPSYEGGCVVPAALGQLR